MTGLVVHVDVVAEKFEKALTLADGRRIRLREDVGKPELPRVKLTDVFREKHARFLLEILLVKLVENYLNYLASLLFEIFLSRPEVLKSSEQIDLMTVLSHESMDSLVRSVAERKVDDLSYRSFNDIAKYFNEKFHIHLCSELEHSEINEAIAFRNISVHNRCVMNKRFIAQTGVDPSWLGEKATFGKQYLQDKARVIVNSVKLADRFARKKFDLKGSRLYLRRERGKNIAKT